ncbi:hypothetical protein CDAR_590551 [Caerostris darwini]|uniref:Uncharacterized protein n=1 Tax=Caerostris darwini TaxID=1538125 RepID=A0AAV4TQ29_9ARAC|nr:hypothetical protein CDAR_590551 [Caerostris darwini]
MRVTYTIFPINEKRMTSLFLSLGNKNPPTDTHKKKPCSLLIYSTALLFTVLVVPIPKSHFTPRALESKLPSSFSPVHIFVTSALTQQRVSAENDLPS